MAKAPSAAGDPEQALDQFMALAGAKRDEAYRIWGRNCALYSQYFDSLAKAGSPDAFITAQTDLIAGAVEVFAELAQSQPPSPVA